MIAKVHGTIKTDLGALRMDHAHDSRQLNRWKAARRLTLGTILLAGSMAISAAAVQQLAVNEAQTQRRACTLEVYSGIGVTIVSRAGQVYIAEVNPSGPAHGKLSAGAVLVSADAHRPQDLAGWKGALTGQPGTVVLVEVAYPESGHQTVAIERAVIRARRP